MVSPSYTLRAYFRSGWAFLIPYLAAYLLYAWLKWPVNPAAGGEGVVKGMSESVGASRSLLPAPCSLLHFYWFLHVAHLLLGGFALKEWMAGARSREPGAGGSANSVLQSFGSSALRAAPWLGLALLFWIPGLYLEWPSDPWEHLRRINEWHILDSVTAHSAWKKSSYFLPYSLTSFTTGLPQLSWLNAYYTAVCLLLCWQYYRLARAAGLGERAAMIFVILQALLMGNTIFSFYRYYGLSSSIFAQLGAVALTRIVLEYFSRPRITRKDTKSESSAVRSQWSVVSSLFSLLAPCSLLLAFTAFSHIQGIGIASLGVLAVIVWRLIEWKRSMIGWLALAAVLASVVTVLWFPRHPALDELYRPHGWLTAWYGFNLFSPASPAFDRACQILGVFGALNLFLGLWLILRKNHVAGWLTLMPVIALILPCFALPFAHILATEKSVGNIITFHRMFFAVPMGLALVAIASRWALGASRWKLATGTYSLPATRYSLLCTGLAGAVLLSPGQSSYNRFWHSLQTTPNDLSLKPYVATWTIDALTLAKKDSTLVVTTPLGARVQEAFVPSLGWRPNRQTHAPFAAAEFEQRLDWLSVLHTASNWTQAITDKKSTELSPDWLFLSRRDPAPRETRVIADFTASDTLWARLGGQPPEQEFTNGRLTISNPVGATSSLFAPVLVPIDRSKRYQLTSTLRQAGNSTATNYLVVVWYDKDGKVLQSHQQQPEGAGRPLGWSNGTYSYYGLANRPAPAAWTSYSITFGPGEAAAIPTNAAFFRAGAFLNHRSTSKTVVQLRDVILQEKPAYEHLLFVVPSQTLHTPASQAAQLSGHWPSHQVSVGDHGSEELRTHFLTVRLPATKR